MENEISIKEILFKINDLKKYLLSKWLIIACFSIFTAVLGLTYSFLSKNKYKSDLTFILEGDGASSGGGLSNLASSFGIGNLGTSNGLFTTINFLELLKSRNLIEKTLLSPYDLKTTFAQKHIKELKIDEDWNEEDEIPELKSLSFKLSDKREKFSIVKDSILQTIYLSISENLKVSQPNDESAIVLVEFVHQNQKFAKNFVTSLIDIASEFYIKTTTKKSQKNVNIIQKQVDSVRVALFNSISGAASANDDIFGLNPAMNIKRVPSANKQVDIQANSAILNELVKNLELAKMGLLNQTPLVQIIDKPIMPLENIKIKKLKGIIVGSLLGFFLIVSYLLIRRYLSKINNN